MGILILPDRLSRRPDFGAGLDRDGPPGSEAREGYCHCDFHDEALPRRFEVKGRIPPTVCPKCLRFMHEYHQKAQEGEVPMGNRIIRGDLIRRGSPPRTC